MRADENLRENATRAQPDVELTPDRAAARMGIPFPIPSLFFWRAECDHADFFYSFFAFSAARRLADADSAHATAGGHGHYCRRLHDRGPAPAKERTEAKEQLAKKLAAEKQDFARASAAFDALLAAAVTAPPPVATEAREKALAFFQNYVETHRQDPDLLAELAGAALHSAGLHAKLGSKESVNAMGNAVVFLTKLSDSNADPTTIPSVQTAFKIAPPREWTAVKGASQQDMMMLGTTMFMTINSAQSIYKGLGTKHPTMLNFREDAVELYTVAATFMTIVGQTARACPTGIALATCSTRWCATSPTTSITRFAWPTAWWRWASCKRLPRRTTRRWPASSARSRFASNSWRPSLRMRSSRKILPLSEHNLKRLNATPGATAEAPKDAAAAAVPSTPM